MPDTYYVTVTYGESGPHDRDRLERLPEALGVRPLADDDTRTLRISQEVVADSLNDAAADALNAAAKARTVLGNLGTPVAVEAATEQHHRDQILNPLMPGVMTLTDIGRRIGERRQQVQRLSKHDPQFPKPAARPATGPLFWAPDVERYAATYQRRPRGRPRKENATVAS